MVHQHRAVKKATITKDVSPMRINSLAINDKHTPLSSSPSEVFGLRSMKLSVPRAVAMSPAASNEHKWKYNNMINNNRDQFNSMHFC